MLNGVDKGGLEETLLRKFVATYGVLMWVVLVSSGSPGQKNIIRALFLLYGTRGEKEASLVGVEKIPSTLKHDPITTNNYVQELQTLSRWEALGLIATGQFLEDDPSLKNGILTRYYEHVKSTEEKSPIATIAQMLNILLFIASYL